jgi:hypothetical protein
MMGLLSKLFDPRRQLDRRRENIRDAYDSQLKETIGEGAEAAHISALIFTLARVYQTRILGLQKKTPPNWELNLSGDIAPFIPMTAADAVFALAESTLHIRNVQNTLM